MLYISGAIVSLLDIDITLSQNWHFNLVVHTGELPVNEPSLLQVLVRSLAVLLCLS